ncbi:pentatricopeptide repeat-containing protein, partial [Quercus suber]
MAGVSPDCFTFPYLLKACCGLLALEMGWQNSLVAMYAKCSQIRHARMVFDGLYDRTIVTWTSIISGYAQNGEPIEALRIFSQMRQSNVKPDWIALMGLEYEPDLLISLTAMYAKCGQVTVARSFFNQMKLPNLILWNAMISGYAKNGYAEEAVGLFHEMIGKNISVDSITVRSAILACAQVGSLELARWMDDYIMRSEYRDDVFVNTALID